MNKDVVVLIPVYDPNEKIMQEFIRIQLYNSSIIQKMGTGNTVTSVSGK